MLNALCPAQIAHVHQPVDAVFTLDESAKSVRLRTRPSTVDPIGYFSCSRSHGFDSSCFSPSEMRRSFEFTLSTTHSISSPTFTSFEGCFMRLDHDISLT